MSLRGNWKRDYMSRRESRTHRHSQSSRFCCRWSCSGVIVNLVYTCDASKCIYIYIYIYKVSGDGSRRIRAVGVELHDRTVEQTARDP